jgi:hypothetical protein
LSNWLRDSFANRKKENTKIKIVMDSGKEYILDIPNFNWFREKVTNHNGVLYHYLIDITGDGLFIVPSHISSIEKFTESPE